MTIFLNQKLRILSFLSVIMVVYLHSFNLVTNLPGFHVQALEVSLNAFIQYYISQGITRIAVPLFFMISGYLFFINSQNYTVKTYLVKIQKRVHSLLIPFLFWSLLSFTTFYILQNIQFSRIFFTDSQNIIANFTSYDILRRIFINPFAHQLWFLKDLIIYVIFTPIIYNIIINFRLFSVMLFLLCWISNINFIFISSEGVFFFILGSYLSLNKINIELKSSKYNTLPIMISWLMIILFTTYTQINYQIMNPYLHKFIILLGLYTFWNMYDLIITNYTKRILLEYSNFTFFLYAIHEPALTILKKLLLKVLGISMNKMLVIYLISPIIIITCALIIGNIIKMKIPKIYNIIVGGR